MAIIVKLRLEEMTITHKVVFLQILSSIGQGKGGPTLWTMKKMMALMTMMTVMLLASDQTVESCKCLEIQTTLGKHKPCAPC